MYLNRQSKTFNAIGGGQKGLITPQNHVSSAPAALVSNRVVANRIAPVRTIRVSSISFRVTTASGTDDPCDVGIYDATGTRLVSSGATTGKLNSTGTKNVDIPDVTLQPGTDYYVAIAATSTATLASAVLFGDIFGSTPGTVEAFTKTTSYPLPTTLASVTASDASPFLWVLE